MREIYCNLFSHVQDLNKFDFAGHIVWTREPIGVFFEYISLMKIRMYFYTRHFIV